MFLLVGTISENQFGGLSEPSYWTFDLDNQQGSVLSQDASVDEIV